MALSMFGKKRKKTKEQPVVQMQQREYGIANLQGKGARSGQEDSFTIMNAFDETLFRERGLFFVVCDGMGGMKDGKLGSETAIASLRRSFQQLDYNDDIAAQLKESIYTASGDVAAVLNGEGGSTAVVGLIYQQKLYYAGVGDSYFYLFRGGMLYRINREQNLCHQNYLEEVRDGNIDPMDYQDRPEAEALTEFLGMIDLEDVDCLVHPLPLQKGDVLLACSDGVGGVLDEAEICEALTLPTEQDICERLEQRLIEYNRKNQDNYTAIVIRWLN